MDHVDLPQVPSSSAIIIPCPADKFAEFVVRLLGKPQIISKNFAGTFSVTREDVGNFFSLIEQRVHEQQEASLVQFTVKVTYNDGTSVEVSTLEEFNSYVEIRPLVPYAIFLTWVYLVNFPNRKFPERQQIDVFIRVANGSFDRKFFGRSRQTSDDESDIYDFLDSIPSLGMHHFVRMRVSSGIIGFRISHTTRSWGLDIEALLRSHIENILGTSSGGFRRLIRDYSDPLGLIGALFCGAAILSGGFGALRVYWATRMAEYSNIAEHGTTILDTLQKKIDFIAGRLTGSDTLILLALGVLYVVITLIASTAFGSFVSANAGRREPSFITISQKSDEYKIALVGYYNSGLWKFIFSFVASVISGVIGNALFLCLW